MSTIKSLIKEVILEEKQTSIKIFYNIDVKIKAKEEPIEPEVPAAIEPEVSSPATAEVPPPAVPETSAVESIKASKKMLLVEDASDYLQKISGEVLVPSNDAMNIQTINDLIEFLSGEKYLVKKTSMEKVLEKEGRKEKKSGKIITPEIQDIILILAGASGQAKIIGDLISKEDKIIIEIKYGNSDKDNIGLKINKNSGTDIISTSILKDGELLSGNFDPALINKYILFYRNSIV